MSGRRKGLDAEREAVAALRAAGLRVYRTERSRGEPVDVDAVIFLAPGVAVEMQIKREERLPLMATVRSQVRAGRVLMYRLNRQPWRVVYLPAPGFSAVVGTVERFAWHVRVAGIEATGVCR